MRINTNNPKCISCLSGTDVIRIVNGLPYKQSKSQVELSHTSIVRDAVYDNNPDWKCNRCGNKWGNKTYTKHIFNFNELKCYSSKGSFIFGIDNELSEVCNADPNGAGVYLVYAMNNVGYRLVYIGISGKVLGDGSIKIRRGGIFDRIVNGKQFGMARRVSWKHKMKADGIDKLNIKWYDTFKVHNHIPRFIEGQLLQSYYNYFHKLPIWNKEY